MGRRRVLLTACIPLMLLVIVPAPAAAREGWFFTQERGRGERQVKPQRRDEMRDSRRDEERQSSQRLSPDERRQLRRDLHDANRDMPSRRGNSRR